MAPLSKKKRLLACGIGMSLLMYYHEESKRKRKWWVRPWKTRDRRQAQGLAANLVEELRLLDPGSFHNFSGSLPVGSERQGRGIGAFAKGKTKKYHVTSLFDHMKPLFWMKSCFFDELLTLVGPCISKQNTNMRDALPAHEKLCATLRFLASGASYF
eukprot:gene16366-18009_t